MTAKLTGRLLLQKCDKVVLKNSFDGKSDGDTVKIVNIAKGLMVYVSFLKGASMKTVENMAKTICTVTIFNSEDDSECTDLGNLPGDLMLIPHFCLGGKLRSKSFQYHGVADKQCAENLFNNLCDMCQNRLSINDKWKSKNCVVQYGLYGYRQDINAEMNGPMSHIVDFND